MSKQTKALRIEITCSSGPANDEVRIRSLMFLISFTKPEKQVYGVVKAEPFLLLELTRAK